MKNTGSLSASVTTFLSDITTGYPLRKMNRRQGANAQNQSLVKFVHCRSKLPDNQYFISDGAMGYSPRKIIRRQMGECPEPIAMARPKKCQPKIERGPLRQAKAHLYVAKPVNISPGERVLV